MTDRIPTFRPRPLTRVPFPLPGKRLRERSGIPREPKRIWLKHRRFVRGHQCCVPGCAAAQAQFAHIRTAANSGTGLKPHDRYGVPLCFNHHREQHDCGQGSFEDRHGIDLSAIAVELVRRSSDAQMRLSLLLDEEGMPPASPVAPPPIPQPPPRLAGAIPIVHLVPFEGRVA